MTFVVNPFPINDHNLAQALTNYPNRKLANCLINGFTHGFHIGYAGKIVSGHTKQSFVYSH